MANEREQDLGHDGLVLWKPFVEASRKIWGSLFDQISDEVRSHLYDLFKAGHAAATAEGIPQADGWVAIETVDDLPKDGLYLLTLANGTVCDSSGFTGFSPDIIAYRPMPTPHQRQSSEGE